MANPLVLIEPTEIPGVTFITMNRPEKRNAMSFALIEALRQATEKISSERAGRAMIFRGNGTSFCAGLDLNEVGQEGSAERLAEALSKFYAAVCASPLVAISAAHGGAMGGGAGLIAASDISIGAPDLKIGFPEVKRGLVAALLTALVRRTLGDRHVRELVLLGQIVEADRALQLGLVNRVVPSDQLITEALSIARIVCSGAPGAIARSKRQLNNLGPRSIEEELKLALDFHLNAKIASEAQEGVRAYLEKREPKWGLRPENP